MAKFNMTMMTAALVVSSIALACGVDESGDEESAALRGFGGGFGQGNLAPNLVDRGREIFRFETYGDEAFWTGTLMMNKVIMNLTPAQVLGVGLKVDSEALPEDFVLDPTDPADTVELIRVNAVLGVVGEVDDGELVSVGVTCALCHSTVDDPSGIGKRLDGFANEDLNPGAILARSPTFTPAEKAVLNSWGPGYYDPYWNVDGHNIPVLIPPIWGLRGVPLETYSGVGVISFWNAYVAITQMGGQGVFRDKEIGVDVRRTPDLVRRHLRPLLAYQLSLETPAPELPSDFDHAAAARGEEIFRGKGLCANCHEGENFTDAGETLHDPDEIPVWNRDYAKRPANKTQKYRTEPLRGLLFQTLGYFHDGTSAPTLTAVVERYNDVLELELSDAEIRDLVQFLMTL